MQSIHAKSCDEAGSVVKINRPRQLHTKFPRTTGRPHGSKLVRHLKLCWSKLQGIAPCTAFFNPVDIVALCHPPNQSPPPSPHCTTSSTSQNELWRPQKHSLKHHRTQPISLDIHWRA